MTEKAAPVPTTPASVETAGKERASIAGNARVVAAGTLLSRVLGLVRDQVMAAVFSRAVTDAFFVAFTLPNVLRQLLAEGAVQSAVLPVLAATREQHGDTVARRFFASVRGLSLVILTIVSALGVAFAPALVDLFASGYHAHPGQYERTVTLTRWVFPYIFFMGTAALGMAALNTHRLFFAAAFAPALLNVAFITFSLLLPAWLGARGYDVGLALAAAVLVGGALQVVAQWPSLRRIGYLKLPRFDFGDPGIREVLRRMGPVLAGMGVYYVDVLLARRFLSELGVGAQSYFSWALRLCDFPQGIFVMALQAATLPRLSMLAARGERAELASTFAFGVRLTLFVALPATVLCVTLAEPLVVLLFQRGAFDAESAHQTARALVAQGSGIWLVALVRQFVSLYYALGDTRTPVLVAALDLAVFVILALSLRGPYDHVGVSAAVTGASAVQMLLLGYFLRAKLPELALRPLLASLLRIVVASGVAGAAAFFSADALSRLGSGMALQGVAGGILGLLGFVLTAAALRSPELGLLARAKRRS
ncbi:MAG TPA: murein biosynthesis integral membrane protein MurJ [Polyangiaceae bacterium]|nr:murein biosynthesis integral membrane protein MurJ [Polyangiaceae bacterium]